MELKILHLQEYLHFYYQCLIDIVDDILKEQTEQKEKKHLFLLQPWIQHPRFDLSFPENW